MANKWLEKQTLMCGFTAIFQNKKKNNFFNNRIVKKMCEAIDHRGPDDEGYIENEIGYLGHKRLKIVDLKNGKQPMETTDGRYNLIYNGEIYNYLNLKKKYLSKFKIKFRSRSDTEVLLYLLANYGTDILNEINGIFSFIFIDNLKKKWIAARDQFGCKPLYFTKINNNEIALSSEIKALIKHPDITPTVNKNGLDQYLYFHYILGNETLFSNIYKIEPGFYYQGKGSEIIKKEKFWQIKKKKIKTNLLYTLLNKNIQEQLLGDVEIGASISGGLDSSIVATIANKKYKNLKLFTGDFNEKNFSEFKYSKHLANSLKKKLYRVIIKRNHFFKEIENIIYMLDEPVAGPSAIPQFIMNKFASKKVKILLGGQGGDELFGGYVRYFLILNDKNIRSIFNTNLDKKIAVDKIIKKYPILEKYEPLIESYFSKNEKSTIEKSYFRILDRTSKLENIFLKKNIINKKKIFLNFKRNFNQKNINDELNKILYYEFKNNLPALLHIEDRAGMSSSLESRIPLLSPEIINFLFNLNSANKINNKNTKILLKKIGKKILPKMIYGRKDKMGYPVPIKLWMKNSNFKKKILNIIFYNKNILKKYYNFKKLKICLEEGDYSDRDIWGIVCLSLWYRKFFLNFKY